jgi:hypothetical protein
MTKKLFLILKGLRKNLFFKYMLKKDDILLLELI